MSALHVRKPGDGSLMLSGILTEKKVQRQLEQRTPNLMPGRIFRAELEREMLRSDRTGSPLTLLLFDVQCSSPSRAHRSKRLLFLADAVDRCSRRVDSKGWFSDEDGLRTGLMLFDTEPQNANRAITTIRDLYRDTTALLPGSETNISCEVFAYAGEVHSNLNKRTWLKDEFFNSEGLEEMDDLDNKPSGETTSYFVPLASTEHLVGRGIPAWKRAIDIFGSLFGLIFLSPLLLAIAIAIKATSKGPIFFKQQRVGFRGNLFNFWKFRSMRIDHDPTEHQRHLEELIESCKDDDKGKAMEKLDDVNPAITWVGRFLRKSSLDELPQLFNVLRGEMSLVGPRPCLPYEAEKYLLWNRRRFDIIPGLTGLWQVMGKNKLSFNKMIRLDITYARNRSFWLDVKILFRTFPAVVQEFKEASQRKKRVRRTLREEARVEAA